MSDTESDAIEGMWDDAMADAFAPDSSTTPTVGDDPPSVLIRLEERLGKAPERVHLPDDLLDDTTEIIDPSSTEVDGGRRVGRYVLLGELARGGMGVVLHGRDVDLGRDVAIKVMQDRYCEQPALIQRFIEEAQVAGQLQHPGVIPVYEMGLDASRRPFFSMKLVRGRTLQSLLHERRDLADDAPRMLHVFEQICQTLAYAHARRVVHRDLKPANVMVGAFGEVQVMDWGMAKVLRRGGVDDEALDAEAEADEKTRIETVRSDGRGSQSLAGAVLGTPSYMPPEQAKGLVSLVDERADVFALGGMLCEILTGHPPYVRKPGSSAMDQAQSASLEPALERLAESAADPELVDLARRCLEPDLRDRPRDAGVVARDISDYLAGTERRAEEARVEAKAANVKIAAERKARRLTTALGVAAVGLVVLVGGGLWWAQSERSAERERNDQELRSLLTEAERRATVEDWRAAGRALHRARAFAETRRTSDVMMARLDVVERELAKLEQASLREAAARKRRADFVARLREIRNQPAEDPLSGDQEYREAFAGYGISIDDLDADAIAARIREETEEVALAMVFALDDWAGRRRLLRRKADWRKLVTAASAADDDQWRSKVRAAMLAEDRDALISLASGVSVEEQKPESLTLLAVGVFREAGAEGRVAAMELLRRAARVYSDDYWVHQQLAVVLAGQFTFDARGGRRREDIMAGEELVEAEVHLQIALALQPHSTMNMVFLANIMQRTNRTAEAREYLSDELKRRSGNEVLEVGLASVLANEGRGAEAMALLEGKEHLPHAARIMYQLRDLGYLLPDDPAAAVARLKRELEDAPKDGNRLCQLGEIHLHLGDHAAAERILFLATGGEGDLSRAWMLLGRAKLEQGKFQEAVFAFDSAEDAEKTEEPRGRRMMTFDLGRLARRLDDGASELDAMLRSGRTPRPPERRVDLARYALFTGRAKEAVALFKALVEDRDRERDRPGPGGRRPGPGGRRDGPRGMRRPLRMGRSPDFWFEAGLAAVLAEDFEFARTCLERNLRGRDGEDAERRPVAPVAGVSQLHRWRHDKRFDPVRGASALAAMTPEDRQQWSRLWALVDRRLSGKP